MNILHIGQITNDAANGVSVTVPKHLLYQSKHENVVLLNIVNFIPEKSKGNYVVEINKNKQTLTHLLDKQQWDLVVFHEIYRPFFIRAYKQVIRRDIPYVIIPHGSLTVNAQKVSKYKKRIANLVFVNDFVNKSLAIHYMSDTERMTSVAPHHKCIVQGSGIELHKNRKTQFSPEGLKIIYVGRLDVEVKGLDILLQTAIEYQKYFRDKKLSVTIAGPDTKGGYSWLDKSITTNGISDIVFLEKPIFGDDKVQKLIESDVFVQLSRTEAQCLGLMEAMDLGLACIVSPGSTFYDVAKTHKLAAPCSGNSKSLFKILAALENNKSIMKKYSLNGSDYIAETYDWKIVGKRIIEDYRQLLGEVQ